MSERNADSLYSKYVVTKADGSPTDPKADYFVLRLDTDPAARLAAHCYAREIAAEFPGTAAELQDKIDWYDFGDPYHQRLAEEDEPTDAGSPDKVEPYRPLGTAKISVESLHHFNCDYCKGWWSIGDYKPAAHRQIYCPHCGLQNTVPVEGGDRTP